MKKADKKSKPPRAKVKAGIQCPSCADTIFSMYRHDFRRCMCGKIFIDGGDDYLRYGAEPPISLEEIKPVYLSLREATRLMSHAVRGQLPAPPPPLSYDTQLPRLDVDWNWRKWHVPSWLGPFPKTGKYAGAIYSWGIAIGPLQIRRWADRAR